MGTRPAPTVPGEAWRNEAGGAVSVRVLHHERVVATGASPERWLYVLHGIYGAGRNWGSVVRRVVRERPDWGAVLVDLREHGASRGFPLPHTIGAAADDVASLSRAIDVPTDAILAHSFGGKVALAYARAHPGAVRQLWIIDSSPEARTPSGSAAEMLSIVRRHPGPFPNRNAAVRAIEGEGIATPVAQWMATNVEASEGGSYRWRLDFDAMEAMLLDFFRTDLWEVVEAPPAGVEVRFVKADASDVLTAEACRRIEAAGRANGRVSLHRAAGGHWLNAENPAAIEALLVEGLPGRPERG